MHIPLYRRLWFGMLVRISVIIGIIIFATFYYLVKHQRQALFDHERQYVMGLSRSVEQSLYYAMDRNDFKMIENIVGSMLGGDNPVKAVRIINKNGMVMVSSQKDEVGKQLSSQEGLCNSCHDGLTPKSDKFVVIEQQNTMKVVNLLFNGPSCVKHHSPTKRVLGALVIDVSKSGIDDLLASSVVRMALSAFLAFGVMVLLTFLVVHVLVTSPIKELMGAMIAAAKGDLNVEVKIPSGNEVGILAKTFNFMVVKLKELHEADLRKEHEITTMQESLRYKAELESLNVQLKSRVLELESANSQIEMMVHDIEEKNFHLEKAVDRLKILYKISRCLTTVLDTDDVIKMIVEKSVSIMKARVGSLMLINPESDELYIKYAIGIDTDIAENVRVKVGDSISGWVAKEAKPLIVHNIEQDERFHMIGRNKYETKSLISTPVVVKGEVVGVLNVNNKMDGSEFTHDELELLNTLAGQTAISLENAKLYLDIQKSYFDTIRALVNAIEAKDKYTRGHSERVTYYSLAVGRKFNLSPKRMEILQHAAILHDIGKIGTDLNILHKNGFLTAEEFEIVKEHPLIGSQILEPIGFLEDVKQIITEHHERFDGKGYPLGKMGDELSLEARIIAVADAFDAMVSDRPYRKAMEIDVALSELTRCAGTQFDPRLVDIFCETVKEDPSGAAL